MGLKKGTKKRIKCIKCGRIKFLPINRKGNICLDCNRAIQRNYYHTKAKQRKKKFVNKEQMTKLCTKCMTPLTSETKTKRFNWRVCDKCLNKYQKQYNRKYNGNNYKCIICGVELDGNEKKFCERHSKARRKELNRINTNKYYAKMRAKCYTEIGDKCVICGGQKEIQFHHTIPYLYPTPYGCRPTHYLKFHYIVEPMCACCHNVWHELKEEFGQVVM